MLGIDVLGTGSRRVVVVNDWLCDTSTWDEARRYLDHDSFTWAFADLRGYGRSRGQRGDFTVEEAAKDVMDVADHLGWTELTVVGHSMSTLIALQVAQTRPERVVSAVLVTPPPPGGFGYDEAIHARLREVALGDDAHRAKALQVMLGDRLSPGWSRLKIERWRATSEPDAVAAYLAMFGVRGLPDTKTPVACPVLAVTGEQDAPPMRKEAVMQALSTLCPRLAVVAIAESGHYPMQEAPPLFVATVERFVGRCDERSAPSADRSFRTPR